MLRILKSLRGIQSNFNKNDLIKNYSSGTEHHQSRIKLQFFEILIVIICILFISSGIVLTLNDFIPGTFSSFSGSNLNFFDAFYFIIIIATTIGYGDIFPKNTIGRVFVLIYIITFILVVSEQLTKLLSLISQMGPGSFSFQENNHVVLISGENLDLIHIIKGIRKYDPIKKIVIISVNKDLSSYITRHELKNIYIVYFCCVVCDL